MNHETWQQPLIQLPVLHRGTDRVPQKSIFDTYRMIRMGEAPKQIDVHFVENTMDPTGLGEPAFPPVFAAVANALYKATGKRYYDQPYLA